MRVIKFYSTACGPCKALTPLLTRVSEELEVDVEAVNVYEDPDLAVHYGIRAVPTLVMVDSDEEVIDRLTGMATYDTLAGWLGEHVCT